MSKKTLGIRSLDTVHKTIQVIAVLVGCDAHPDSVNGASFLASTPGPDWNDNPSVAEMVEQVLLS